MAGRITYRVTEYPMKAKNKFHNADLDFLRSLYEKFVSLELNEFRNKLEDRMYRNDLQHFIQFVCWVKCLPGYELHFLISDYGALHLLTHMEWDENVRKNYAESLQQQIKDYCEIPSGWTPKGYKSLYKEMRKNFEELM